MLNWIVCSLGEILKSVGVRIWAFVGMLNFTRVLKKLYSSFSFFSAPREGRILLLNLFNVQYNSSLCGQIKLQMDILGT